VATVLAHATTNSSAEPADARAVMAADGKIIDKETTGYRESGR
jgi:hypothetical protein